jgi:hypothetical protein
MAAAVGLVQPTPSLANFSAIFEECRFVVHSAGAALATRFMVNRSEFRFLVFLQRVRGHFAGAKEFGTPIALTQEVAE